VKSLHNASDSLLREVALERLWSLVLILGQAMQSGLAERGLTVARAHLLWQLQQDGAVTQRALSRALRVTPRNVTGLIDGLEADGLVARAPHPTDRRATLVTLTPKGNEVAAAMRRDQDGAAQLLFRDVSSEDMAAFVSTLDHVLGRLRETAGLGASGAIPADAAAARGRPAAATGSRL
jgi:DNA-binding MarR family transcriptional regulator